MAYSNLAFNYDLFDDEDEEEEFSTTADFKICK